MYRSMTQDQKVKWGGSSIMESVLQTYPKLKRMYRQIHFGMGTFQIFRRMRMTKISKMWLTKIDFLICRTRRMVIPLAKNLAKSKYKKWQNSNWWRIYTVRTSSIQDHHNKKIKIYFRNIYHREHRTFKIWRLGRLARLRPTQDGP